MQQHDTSIVTMVTCFHHTKTIEDWLWSEEGWAYLVLPAVLEYSTLAPKFSNKSTTLKYNRSSKINIKDSAPLSPLFTGYH